MNTEYHNQLSKLLSETVDLLSRVIEDEPYGVLTDRIEKLRDAVGDFEHHWQDNDGLIRNTTDKSYYCGYFGSNKWGVHKRGCTR